MTVEARRKRQIKPADGIIRPYEARDRAAVREISCRTAFRNMGCEKMFEDRELHADYWTSYYTDHAPQDAQVIEQDGDVIGYFFGLTDHRNFHRVMARKIVPWTLLRSLWRSVLRRYKKPETYRYIRFSLFQAWREEPKINYGAYPATYHCNMLRKAYGQGYYSTLVLAFLDRLDALGIKGIHGHITEPAGKGIWKRLEVKFSEGFPQEFDETPCTLFERVLGDERAMMNMAWAYEVDDCRKWANWIRETQGI